MQEWELKPKEIKQKIGDMEWSYSRLSGFSGCAYAWYRAYICQEEGEENAFAQFGSLCHKCIEMFLNGELDIFTAAQWYQDHYSEYVTCDFPSNKYKDLGEAAYEAGLEYFNNISFDFNRYEVLGVEKEYHFKIGDYRFKGFVDALYLDKYTKEIIIRDHKSSHFRYLKNGEISKSNLDQFNHYVMQELIYSIPVIEEYGRVDFLSWNMFRDRREIKIPFDANKLEETKEWVINTIHQIEQELLWAPDNSKENSYFCNTLCNFRRTCPYRQIG